MQRPRGKHEPGSVGGRAGTPHSWIRGSNGSGGWIVAGLVDLGEEFCFYWEIRSHWRSFSREAAYILKVPLQLLGAGAGQAVGEQEWEKSGEFGGDCKSPGER